IAERTHDQCRRVDHRIVALPWPRFSVGQIQGAAAQVWAKSRGVRLLSVYRNSGKLRRIQPEGFSAGHALLPEERRSYSRETTHLHRRAKQCARAARARRAKSLRAAI